MLFETLRYIDTGKLSPIVQTVLENALFIASRSNERLVLPGKSVVGMESLVVAVLDEKEHAVTRALNDLGVTHATFRAALQKRLDGPVAHARDGK